MEFQIKNSNRQPCLPAGANCQPRTINDQRYSISKKSRWALLKIRFRNSLFSLNENREKKLDGPSANGQRPQEI
jgi:hypothetical protein